MSEFLRVMPSFRLVEVRYDDDLQAIAARELGDANRWPELVWLNSLRHPYITTLEAAAGDGVLLVGSLIKVPAPAGLLTDASSDGQVYERDCAMAGGLLSADADGDIAVVSGADNLRQQLTHRISTPTGQARRHPEYGCMVWRLLGRVNGPTAGALGAQYVRAALESDYRVSKVSGVEADVSGDSVKLTATATAIDGGVVDLSAGS